MAEYIERNAFGASIIRNAHNFKNAKDVEYAGFLALVEPIADVVEVVRCKECVLRGTDDCAMYYRCECGTQYSWESDNDFCSYGERKDR